LNNKNSTNNNKIISFIPDGQFYYKKAIQELERDRFEEAHKFLKRATELSPNDPLILMQYGVVIMEDGRFDEAHEVLMTSHTLDPKASETIFYLAEVYAHLGLLRDAKEYAKKYLIINPDGHFGDESKEIIDFVEQKESFFEEDEGVDGEVYFLQEKARRLMEAGEFPEAVKLLETIILENPEFWAAHNNLALAYFYVGQKEKALTLLHDVLKENKGNYFIVIC